MKQITVLFVMLSMLVLACRKEQVISTVPAGDMIDTMALLQYRAQWMNGGYGTANGVVKIFRQNTAYSLVLDSFMVNEGPDLHVYLSQELQPLNFIDLGRLRSTSGTQVYTINGNPDFALFKYALIHCQQFDHLFGSAILQ